MNSESVRAFNSAWGDMTAKVAVESGVPEDIARAIPLILRGGRDGQITVVSAGDGSVMGITSEDKCREAMPLLRTLRKLDTQIQLQRNGTFRWPREAELQRQRAQSSPLMVEREELQGRICVLLGIKDTVL